jgi:hypothetical protein
MMTMPCTGADWAIGGYTGFTARSFCGARTPNATRTSAVGDGS